MRDGTPETEVSELLHVRDYQSRRCPLRSAPRAYDAKDFKASLRGCVTQRQSAELVANGDNSTKTSFTLVAAGVGLGSRGRRLGGELAHAGCQIDRSSLFLVHWVPPHCLQ